MEHEERDEIPWSSLVAEVEESLDRRWIIVGAVVLAIVVGFVGIKLFDQPTQPTLPSSSPIAEGDPVAATTTSTVQVLSEEDLRANDEGSFDVLVSTRAEWFVSDFFTVDGSAETVLSIRGAMVPDLRLEPIPHDEDEEHTYVEWARTYRITRGASGAYVAEVAFRSIISSEGVFERLPVRTVKMEIEMRDGVPLVATIPADVVSSEWTN
ncbi:MAG: hypothetical protein ACR2N2_06885 [Acidimicrobiia bacterium]